MEKIQNTGPDIEFPFDKDLVSRVRYTLPDSSQSYGYETIASVRFVGMNLHGTLGLAKYRFNGQEPCFFSENRLWQVRTREILLIDSSYQSGECVNELVCECANNHIILPHYYANGLVYPIKERIKWLMTQFRVPYYANSTQKIPLVPVEDINIEAVK